MLLDLLNETTFPDLRTTMEKFLSNYSYSMIKLQHVPGVGRFSEWGLVVNLGIYPLTRRFSNLSNIQFRVIITVLNFFFFIKKKGQRIDQNKRWVFLRFLKPGKLNFFFKEMKLTGSLILKYSKNTMGTTQHWFKPQVYVSSSLEYFYGNSIF